MAAPAGAYRSLLGGSSAPCRDRGGRTARPGHHERPHPQKPQPGNYRNRFGAPAFLPRFLAIRCKALQWFAIALECER